MTAVTRQKMVLTEVDGKVEMAANGKPVLVSVQKAMLDVLSEFLANGELKKMWPVFTV